MSTTTLTITGNRLPVRHLARILHDNDRRSGFVSEITSPMEAFRIIEGARYDKVRVVKPKLVEIKTFQVL